ncbi:WecB/TagA/CpsF family glycosyltransferase [Flavisolibacter sp. BT320]|nr:WecB/TagA/CpsF family glycosyltransferase [Flavisolibacter longurius]
MKKTQLLNFPLSLGSYSSFIEDIIASARLKQSRYTCVANVHMLIEAYRNPSFAELIQKADRVAPDGMPLVWGLRLVYGIKQERVAGMDLLPDLLQRLEDEEISPFIYGGSPEMLQRTKDYFIQKFPSLKLAGLYSPPFRSLTPEEECAVVNMINESGAGVVFVVLGCPKQEKWMAAMRGRVTATMIGIGGALPVLIGIQRRAPKWMQRLGLEWFYRLMQEPKRLFKRYALTNSAFIYLLMRECISVKIFRRTASYSES